MLGPDLRPSLDDTLMAVAFTWSRRSTCNRRQVGAVLVRDGRQVSQGYNGAPAGLPHCRCDASSPCVESVHGEVNVIANAAYHGAATAGATMYVTDAPCLQCSGLIVNAGIVEVVYARDYRLTDGLDRLRAAGITVRMLGRLG